MPTARKGDQQISDEAVRSRTGRGWQEWFSFLDDWGAREKGHKATARYLADEQGVSGWWAQMVTVQYERERAGREVHQRGKEFTISVHRTIRSDIEDAYKAWTDPSLRARWFGWDVAPGGAPRSKDGEGYPGTAVRVVLNQLLKYEWRGEAPSSETAVEVVFTVTAADKVRVGVTHSKLQNQEEALRTQEAWRRTLDGLKGLLEEGARRTTSGSKAVRRTA